MSAATARPVTDPVRRRLLTLSTPGVAGLVAVTVLLAAGLTVRGVLMTRFTVRDVLSWAALAACAAICVEAVRRVGEAAGASNDLLSAWTLPVALLLPPVYSLLIPIPVTVLLQLRVGRGRLHRRLFSIAAIGLSNWAVSVSFHRYLQWQSAGGTAVATGFSGDPATRAATVLVAFGCAALGCALNVFFVGSAVRLAAPGTAWRGLVLDREQRVVDLGEICLGVAVAVCWFVTPVLAVAMLAPVLLVQRSLTHAQLRAAARTDDKTGLLNAMAWQSEAEREIVRARRTGTSVAVLIADIDHFKTVNDTHGHLAGDVALVATVAALSAGLRPYDQLGRFGGEEFTVVLPGAGPAEAASVAERLRQQVAAVPVRLGDASVELTVSVGVAVLGDHGEDLTDLLAAADLALYRAKGAGRNRVALAP